MFKIQVTYKLITRSEIKVLAKYDNIHCLGKRDQCRERKNMIWGYLVPRDRLERRYYSIKAPDPQGKDQIAREGGNTKDSARVWRTLPWDLGQMESL